MCTGVSIFDLLCSVLPKPFSVILAGGGYARRCARGGSHASCGPSLREKLIDVSRSLSKSALSLQVRAGRGDSITPGIENRDLITVIALVVQAPRRSPFRIGTCRPAGRRREHDAMSAISHRAPR